MELVLIHLVATSLILTVCISNLWLELVFNQIGEHESQPSVLRFSLYVYQTFGWNWFLIRLVNMSLNPVFSDSHCMYIKPLVGTGF